MKKAGNCWPLSWIEAVVLGSAGRRTIMRAWRLGKSGLPATKKMRARPQITKIVANVVAIISPSRMATHLALARPTDLVDDSSSIHTVEQGLLFHAHQDTERLAPQLFAVGGE